MKDTVLQPVADLEDWFDHELSHAFPPQELKPLSMMKGMVREGRYRILGLYDGGRLLGYSTLWLDPAFPEVQLLDYLGVTSSLRNRGLGAEILSRLKRQFAGATLLIESETPVPGGEAEENALRSRRIGFYQRCGFIPAYEMATCGMRFLTLTNRPLNDPPAVMERHRGIYGPSRVDVVIPLPAGANPPPSLFIPESKEN